MNKNFDNLERFRYYGLRIGDIVDLKGVNGKVISPNAEVIDYGSDNNRVQVKDMKGIRTVQENLQKIRKY